MKYNLILRQTWQTLGLVWKQLGLHEIPEVIVLPFHITCHMCVIIIHIHPAL